MRSAALVLFFRQVERDMEAVADRPTTRPVDDLVILVHGTYAARDTDSGDLWWQQESRPWRELRKRLPPGVQLAGEGELFHWSGENSERSRIKAGRDLLEYLSELESEQRGYHLVGHSHGGSVIWHALCRARLQRKELTCLRSWSTVGTPYLQHRTRSMWHVLNVINLLLAVALLRPAYYTLQKLTQVAGAALLGRDEGITLARTGVAQSMPVARDVGLRVLEWLGVSVTETAQGIQLGSYDPAGGKSLFEYLFLSVEGWLILGVAILCAYVYLNLATFFLGPLLESFWIRKEDRMERDVMRTYQGRWLGIWSPEDEAINGLRTTIKLSISFVSRMTLRESVLFSDWLSVVSRPYHWILVWFYNALLRPMLDGLVRSHVIKTAQGNNRPGAEVVAVSPAPVESIEPPCLPGWLSAKISAEADRHARDIAPKLRKLLAEPSFVSGLQACGETMTGQELVHTSYFDHAEVLELLAANIAWAVDAPPRLSLGNARSIALWGWFRQYKQYLGVYVASPEAQGSAGVVPAPARVVPRRRYRAA
ncbi:MAG: lipase family protein [Pirellulaceae bacterium]